MTKGTGPLDETKLQSVVNTLSHLRAVRWAGAVRPEYGLDAPTLTLTFDTPGDPKGHGTLLLGGLSPDSMAYAKVEGKEGAFLVTAPITIR